MNQEAKVKELVDMITMSKEKKHNYWSDIASVICCERSDVYLRTLIGKVRSNFEASYL